MERKTIKESRVVCVEVLERGDRHKSKKSETQNTTVYDIQVEGTHNFFANNCLVHNCMIRRKKEDVLKELPPKTRTLVPLEIDNSKEYKRAHNHFIEYLTNIDPEKAKRAKRAETLTQLNTLRQLAVQGKMSSALEWIENFLENDKLVLFTYHHKTVDEVMKKFSKVAVKLDGRDSGAKKKEAEEKFQYNEDVRLFVGQIKAAGVGLTLTASSNVAFLEYPWSPGEYVQAEDRSHRIGQEDNVMVWNLIAAETIEKNTALLLEEKAKVISAVIDGDESEDSGIFNKLINQLRGE